MRKIVLDLATTLDGYIEGPNGETDWCIMDDDMGFEDFLSSVDTIFYGRVSYDMWGNYRPDQTANEAEKAMWSQVHSKKKFVFTSKPAKDNDVTFITSEIEKMVADIRRQKGKDIWLYGGAKLIHTFINLQLIDVYRISVHPTVLGAGKPLFENIKHRINLRLMEVHNFRSGVVQLIYAPQTAG